MMMNTAEMGLYICLGFWDYGNGSFVGERVDVEIWA